MQSSSVKSYGVIALILVFGIVGFYVLLKTAPKPAKRINEVEVPLVEVMPLSQSDLRPSWVAGTSANANPSVALMAQVSGQITELKAEANPGAYLQKGTVLAEVDSSLYFQNLQQRKAAVTQAQANLDIEQGQAQQALSEYKLSAIRLKKEAKSLALRKPQLASAKAALNIAKADLAKAKLDLQRTKITMPFDGYVMDAFIDTGSFVNSNVKTFELVKSEAFWLEVKVPAEFAEILDVNQAVKIQKLKELNGNGKHVETSREAKVISVLPMVDANDRQVRVLISIEQPLSNEGGYAIIRYNDYVKATLFGQEFNNALRVNTDQLNGHNHIWVVDEKRKLQKRAVDVLFKGRQYSWVKVDTQVGDELLVSNLSSMKEGMAVRLPQEDKKTSVASEESL